MDPVKLDEIRKKRNAELMAQLNELKPELKERSLPGAKVTDGAPNKLSEIEKLHPFFSKEMKKRAALQEELREAYSNREPLILRLNSQEDPCCTAASSPGQEEWVVKRISGRCLETVSSKYLTD
ncbi:hypothetical protein ACQ4PT_051954 [Festuca glaucescens]